MFPDKCTFHFIQAQFLAIILYIFCIVFLYFSVFPRVNMFVAQNNCLHPTDKSPVKTPDLKLGWTDALQAAVYKNAITAKQSDSETVHNIVQYETTRAC